jgi:sortase A
METDQDKKKEKRPKSRRRWLVWVANLMILGGIAAVAYVPGTWAYTWFEQRNLRNELLQQNPAMTSSQTNSTVQVDAKASADAAAKAKQKAELAAFKAAALAYQLKVANQTGKPIGIIIIPKINLKVVMVEGTGKGDLKEGPGHWPETPFPGEGGNFVVSGHRTTYGHPFFYLNRVNVGDQIELELPYAIAYYTVTKQFIVSPDQVDTVAQRGFEQISLAACNPIYSAKQRIVVQGNLTSFELIGSAASTQSSTTSILTPTTGAPSP